MASSENQTDGRSIQRFQRRNDPGIFSVRQNIIMDIVFNCPHCRTELEVESSAAGENIPCPSCNREIQIPAASTAAPVVTPAARPAATGPAKTFSVPVTNRPAQPLITKALPSLEKQAKIESRKQVRIKTLRRSDHKHGGNDHFDDAVGEFLGQIGEDNLISISPIQYSHMELGTPVVDYGVIIVYRA
jgi:hypothetical protein